MATLSIHDIFDELSRESIDRLHIVPQPDKTSYTRDDNGFKCDVASIDLNLGQYFVLFDRSNLRTLDPAEFNPTDTSAYSTLVHVPIGTNIVLQPQEFLLGVTLQWIKLPINLSAYVVGKSSLGRMGLIIETAGMIHPKFCGCLTLEISNLSSVPVAIYPGMSICQIVIHECKNVDVSEDEDEKVKGGHKGSRVPRFGADKPNENVQNMLRKTKKIRRGKEFRRLNKDISDYVKN